MGDVMMVPMGADMYWYRGVCACATMQLWDTRQNASAAVMTMRDDSDNDMYELHDVCVNPGQPDKVATGGGDGVLSVWDIRHPTFPQTCAASPSRTPPPLPSLPLLGCQPTRVWEGWCDVALHMHKNVVFAFVLINDPLLQSTRSAIAPILGCVFYSPKTQDTRGTHV